LDPAFGGSSTSAIVVTRYYNGKVQVLDAIEIENAEYNEVIDRVWNIKKKYGISTLYCDAANPVIWKPFSVNPVKMLQHLSALLDKGFIQIHPKFENLINSLRSALSIDYKLDKTRSAHNDVLDALRLSVQLYDIK
jgi:hypothetical protein